MRERNPAKVIAPKAGINAIASSGHIGATISAIRGNRIEFPISAFLAAGTADSGASSTAREMPMVYAVVEASAPTTAVSNPPRTGSVNLVKK